MAHAVGFHSFVTDNHTTTLLFNIDMNQSDVLHNNIMSWTKKCFGASMHAAMVGMWDIYRINYVTLSLWMDHTDMYTGDNYSVPQLYSAYDPDAKGRVCLLPNDILKMVNHKKRTVYPNKKYYFRLYPRHSTIIDVSQTRDKSLNIEYAMGRNPFRDCGDPAPLTPSVKCINGFQLALVCDKNTVWCMALTANYTFGGRRRGQQYSHVMSTTHLSHRYDVPSTAGPLTEDNSLNSISAP